MAIKLDEYTLMIKQQVERYADKIIDEENGYVVTVADGIIWATGLTNAICNEIVKFENGSQGIVLNLEVDSVGIVALGEYDDIREGSLITRTKHVIKAPIGDSLIGRVVNALGSPIDNGPALSGVEYHPIDALAPGVMERLSVTTPLETGILAIDSMFPIGKGQRELIIGDRQTGKTTIAIDTIINQRNKNVKCVYVAIGQKASSVAQIYRTLHEWGAMDYTVIVSATAADLPSLLYVAPFVGITIAEGWRKKGCDVLIAYDDLSKHAVAYRTISLLLRRPPGREAYPGDIFYLHSRLLERAGRINSEHGGGSITALPIVETQSGDISAYIPTNVISITDGQLFTLTSMFNAGQRPAIDPGLSVSRVGAAAQIAPIKKVSSSLKLELAQFRELSAFSQFGSDLDTTTKLMLEHGKRIMEIIKQSNEQPLSVQLELLFLFLIKTTLIKWIPLHSIDKFKVFLINIVHNNELNHHNEQRYNREDSESELTFLLNTIIAKNELSPELSEKLESCLKKVIKEFSISLPDYDQFATKVGNIKELDG